MKVLFIFFSCLLVLPFSAAANQLDSIKQKGVLTIVSRYTPIAFHTQNQRTTGLEYELALQFARSLGVKLVVIVPDNITHLMQLIKRGEADIAAAGLTITDERKDHLTFGPSYQTVTQQLIYHRNNTRPKSFADIGQKQIEVVANSSHVQQLILHRHQYPDLYWIENDHLHSAMLIELVQSNMIDYTIVNSDEFTALRHYYPELNIAFSASPPQQLAWAVKNQPDHSLINAINTFFGRLISSGKLERLLAEHYAYLTPYDGIDTRIFYKRLLTTLPAFQAAIQDTADAFQLDWRLLAAIAYQESHWNPDAVSYTGVRGLMMVTRATAKEMQITDRMDPIQSLYAGAKYLVKLKKRLPKKILEPDRTWFTLAAYNIGLGHLEDARVITQQQGYDPNKWIDVKHHLPLLTKKKWYSQTKYGYARGHEPVHYIENIRRYYDILRAQYKKKLISESHIADTIFDIPIPNAL